MFQFAAGVSAAHRLDCALELDVSLFGVDGLRSFLLERFCIDVAVASGVEIEALRAGLVSRGRVGQLWSQARGAGKTDKIYRQPGFHFDAQGWPKVGPGSLLVGYFQSERYFADVAPQIRDLFRLKHPVSEGGQKVFAQIRSTDVAVALHIRRGDYVGSNKVNQVHGTCSPDYYRRAIQIMGGLTEKRVTYFVFSDDTVYAAEFAAELDCAVVVEGSVERPWEDMILIAACHHQIIANSSFSWWGAWLNDRDAKIVIAPRNWFQRDAMLINNTVDLYPADWITL
ncbi:alpha-1,2-fucosyltransferase [cf. Phormidesmis sp. LEGE 11477]|uniref:alpha-1,2-fucosyltransferase n=1 Tax=cf. Phormidesmis sp. LEGE 11477 TaxID=1828680 RepID=UPI001D13AF0B|nr:alpha-1,2-fucosyltransferase [cf. Phormidesmis sp. LEGE 11477]